MDCNVDALYAGFVGALPDGLRDLAFRLPHELGLAPAPGLSWSKVFAHRVTLEAPAMLAEAFPRVEPGIVRLAVLGQILSVIEAFGFDRVADGQVQPTSELLALLEHFRAARDRALEGVHPGAARLGHLADQETRVAIQQEHTLLGHVEAVSFDEYRRVSSGKQAVGLPASVALAQAAGATASQIEETTRALRCVWLGLQFEDDVADWEDDWRQGRGAWAVSLTRRRLEVVKEQPTDDRPTEPDVLRRRVFNMRVLYLMLRAARHQYRSAWRYSRGLGASNLAAWADERKRNLDDVLPKEESHAGYFVRARKLASWAAEVLS
jgi:hypothetical protein